MMRRIICLGSATLWIASVCHALPLPGANERVVPRLPDLTRVVSGFDRAERAPVSWSQYVINAGWGGGRGGPERQDGWIAKHWMLIDYLDRSGDFTSNEWLANHGIWFEVYGSNEYQETIHFTETGARELLWDNGIERDYNGNRVLSPEYNTSQQWWKDSIGWDAYIACNNAPRWSAIINYDLIGAAALGHAISQDNIGGPTSRIGEGSHGRYCDYCNLRFLDYLDRAGKLPEFRAQYKSMRDYVRETQTDVLRQLPPLGKWTYDPQQADVIAKLCDPPVLAEYQRFVYLSQLSDWLSYYTNMKLAAHRVDGREIDVHGNQGGSAIGSIPYQVALMDFVDTVWFESSGISAYDNFRWHWNNADGAFRYVIGRAMTRGTKPFMSMTAFQKDTPDIVEHEMAEACAGGGALFVNQEGFAEKPEVEQKLTDYYRFRQEHRALYQPQSSTPLSDVALVYSIPTMMYHDYMYAVSTPLRALCGIARACQEGHIPYDVVILNHPLIHADHWKLEDLRRYRVLVLPAPECLSDAQIETLTAYLRQGGTLAVSGDCGVRNEDNLPRPQPPLGKWERAGRVVRILPGRTFLPPRVVESDETAQQTRDTVTALREALRGREVVSGQLPRLLWAKTWAHGGFVSAHLVNYDVDFGIGAATPTPPVAVTLSLPTDLQAETATWLVPGQREQTLPLKVQGDQATVTIPSVRVYGILVVGRAGAEAKGSEKLLARALAARAHFALGREQPVAADRPAAERLLQEAQQSRQGEYLAGLRKAADASRAVKAFAFGAKQLTEPWQTVAPDTAYTTDRGFGWLPNTDDSDPTPEETFYYQAAKYGKGFLGPEPAVTRLPFWPYGEPVPAPLQFSLSSGTPRTFRVDVGPGTYTVRVVTTNPSWTNYNFRESGMVRCNGLCQLLDALHEKSALVAREFQAVTADGHLDLTFGGPTGWGVAAVVVTPAQVSQEARTALALRSWQVSGRYANPEWWPVVSTSLDSRLNDLPLPGWTAAQAPAEGLPLVDLGSNREAKTGDVVYAATIFDWPRAGQAELRFGASSQAELFVNGKPAGLIPNEKGVREEFRAYVPVRKGQNKLVVKLQRFWERRWMFYGELAQR
jgi:hypothetical protein